MKDANTSNPISWALGFSLALTASLGILISYYFGHGKPTIYWLSMAACFIVFGGIGLGIRQLVKR